MQIAGCNLQLTGKRKPISSGIVFLPFSRCSSADFSAPSGWLPCKGRSSCCGSPSRTKALADCETARTSAKDIWPASSMNRTSTASKAASGDHSQDVPPTTFALPEQQRRPGLFIVFFRDGNAVAFLTVVLPYACTALRSHPFVARLQPHLEQFTNYFVAQRRDTDLLSSFHQFANHARARIGLSRTGRPLNRKDRIGKG